MQKIKKKTAGCRELLNNWYSTGPKRGNKFRCSLAIYFIKHIQLRHHIKQI